MAAASLLEVVLGSLRGVIALKDEQDALKDMLVSVKVFCRLLRSAQGTMKSPAISRDAYVSNDRLSFASQQQRVAVLYYSSELQTAHSSFLHTV